MKTYLITTAVLITVLFGACKGNRPPETTDTFKATVESPPPVDTAMVPPKEKVKFYDPIVMEVDTDFGVKFVGQHFDVRPNTPALNTMLETYLKNCYSDYHRLPSRFIIHYASERARIISSKGVKECIDVCQESLRQLIPGADKTENAAKFPLLYQTKF